MEAEKVDRMMWYVIWSNEHGAFWGHRRLGYVKSIDDAGRYSLAEANAIADNANEYSPVTNEVVLLAPECAYHGATFRGATY